MRFVNCAFWGPCNQIARIAGTGTVGFSDCTFVQWGGKEGNRAAIQAQAAPSSSAAASSGRTGRRSSWARTSPGRSSRRTSSPAGSGSTTDPRATSRSSRTSATPDLRHLEVAPRDEARDRGPQSDPGTPPQGALGLEDPPRRILRPTYERRGPRSPGEGPHAPDEDQDSCGADRGDGSLYVR